MKYQLIKSIFSAAMLIGLMSVAQAETLIEMSAGKKAFNKDCAICHTGFSTGAMMLERRLGKDKSELYKRTDLQEEYIRAVVRNGINSMPAITRVEVTEEQLDEIVTYLTRNNPMTDNSTPEVQE